jgi:hypothetical protein
MAFVSLRCPHLARCDEQFICRFTVLHSNRDTGPTVDVVLWGERATAFPAEQVHKDSGSSPQIIIFVGTLVRSYAGKSITALWLLS